jgi:uncharacterized protein YdeI (YjbR/CyaY-like superfamily)
MEALRPVLLDLGLTESIKWGKPCYSAEEHNIAIIQEMKGFLSLMFFKGALIADPAGMLVDQGPNSRSAKRLEFRSIAEVQAASAAIASFVAAAVDAERAGVTAPPAPTLQLADELAERLAADADLAAAFDALTPGRQREYNMHISDAKQSATRSSRIDKVADRILAGKGLRDR